MGTLQVYTERSHGYGCGGSRSRKSDSVEPEHMQIPESPSLLLGRWCTRRRWWLEAWHACSRAKKQAMNQVSCGLGCTSPGPKARTSLLVTGQQPSSPLAKLWLLIGHPWLAVRQAVQQPRTRHAAKWHHPRHHHHALHHLHARHHACNRGDAESKKRDERLPACCQSTLTHCGTRGQQQSCSTYLALHATSSSPSCRAGPSPSHPSCRGRPCLASSPCCLAPSSPCRQPSSCQHWAAQYRRLLGPGRLLRQRPAQRRRRS